MILLTPSMQVHRSTLTYEFFKVFPGVQVGPRVVAGVSLLFSQLLSLKS